jgi:hypothetical protein
MVISSTFLSKTDPHWLKTDEWSVEDTQNPILKIKCMRKKDEDSREPSYHTHIVCETEEIASELHFFLNKNSVPCSYKVLAGAPTGGCIVTLDIGSCFSPYREPTNLALDLIGKWEPELYDLILSAKKLPIVITGAHVMMLSISEAMNVLCHWESSWLSFNYFTTQLSRLKQNWEQKNAELLYHGGCAILTKLYEKEDKSSMHDLLASILALFQEHNILFPHSDLVQNLETRLSHVCQVNPRDQKEISQLFWQLCQRDPDRNLPLVGASARTLEFGSCSYDTMIYLAQMMRAK